MLDLPPFEEFLERHLPSQLPCPFQSRHSPLPGFGSRIGAGHMACCPQRTYGLLMTSGQWRSVSGLTRFVRGSMQRFGNFGAIWHHIAFFYETPTPHSDLVCRSHWDAPPSCPLSSMNRNHATNNVIAAACDGWQAETLRGQRRTCCPMQDAGPVRSSGAAMAHTQWLRHFRYPVFSATVTFASHRGGKGSRPECS